MANDGSVEGAPWPMPNTYFSVDIGSEQNISFQKIHGLHIRYNIVEYRGGTSKEFKNVKMPLGQSVSDVTLIRGMFANDTVLWDWFHQIKLNTIKRETVTIKLLDEGGNIVFKWELQNAFPKEIAFGELDAMANTFAIEELVIACEGIEFSKG